MRDACPVFVQTLIRPNGSTGYSACRAHNGPNMRPNILFVAKLLINFIILSSLVNIIFRYIDFHCFLFYLFPLIFSNIANVVSPLVSDFLVLSPIVTYHSRYVLWDQNRHSNLRFKF